MRVTSFVSPVWGPSFSPVYIPDLPLLSLTEPERALVNRLNTLQWRQRTNLLVGEAYYRGEQQLASLGIALPPELDGLRVVLGWARSAVDPYVERLAVDSFRKGSELDADDQLSEIMQSNNWPALENLAFTDALAMGRSWWMVNSPDEDDTTGDPDICVESPLNVSATWNVRTGKPEAVLQSYFEGNNRMAALYLPDQTIQMGQQDGTGVWEIVNRDIHNFGFVPCVRQANRARSNNRDGSSEITNELMSVIDAAIRILLNLTAASEFYSVPQKLILGATEEDFLGSDGTPKSAWETYIGRVLALQRDSEGALPEVKTFDAYDPSVFTKVIEMYAAQAAGMTGATPQELGLYTDGNPVAAEALQVAEARRDRRTLRMQADGGQSMTEVAQLALRIKNGGDLPSGYERLAVDWRSPQAVNFTGAADGISKLTQEGILAPASDVGLRYLGFNALDRKRIKAEIEADPVRQQLIEIGQAVLSKDIRMTNATEKAGQADPTTTSGGTPSAAKATAKPAK
jgi:hypothetical protein